MGQGVRDERRVFQPAEDPDSLKRRSGMIETFFGRDPKPSEPIVVVHHIQKTAGTSLRRVVRTNLLPAEVEVARDQRSALFDPVGLRDWYDDWYRSLEANRRARLCCVMSHSAGYLLPSLDRPAVALALVREPVDRVISFHEYKRGISDSRRERGRKYRPVVPLEEIYGPGRAGRAAWLARYFNWQSRALLSVFYDIADFPWSAGPSPDAELWRARLGDLVDGVFFAGVQDRFAEYVELLARRFGWRAVVTRAKAAEGRLQVDQLPDELRETIRAYNWLDAELHELCRRTQMRRESESRGFGLGPS